MYYQESDILLQDNPEYREQIETIDRFIHSLDPEEQTQFNPEIVADITGINIRIIRFIFDDYSKHGLLKVQKYLLCPTTDNILREFDAEELDSLPILEFCDICGIEHNFNETEVSDRYSLLKFAKKLEVKEMNATKPSIIGQSITKEDEQAISDTMPILVYLSNVVNNKPLKDKRVIAVLHFLKDLIPFMHALEASGINPSETLLFYKEYLYPHKDQIIDYLGKKGYMVSSIQSLDEMLLTFQQKCVAEAKPIILIEDGGYLVPRIHDSDYDILRSQTIGAVEQTTKGERQDLGVKNLAFPVLSIAKSELKNRFEPPNVARAVVMNIQGLIPNVNFNSKEALLIGYGAIGKEIARQLKDTLRMNVTVFDLDKTRLLEAQQEAFRICQYLENCMQGKFLIVGATGETSIGRNELLSMEHNVNLVSASSDQREIGLNELKALSSTKEPLQDNSNITGTKFVIRGTEKSINLIADGYPINFWAKESMPNRVSDVIMSLIYISAIDVALNSEALDKKVLTDRVNELEKSYGLAELYTKYQ